MVANNPFKTSKFGLFTKSEFMQQLEKMPSSKVLTSTLIVDCCLSVYFQCLYVKIKFRYKNTEMSAHHLDAS